MKAFVSFAAGIFFCSSVSAAELSARPGDYSIEDGRTVVLANRTVKLRHIAVPPLGTVCLMRGKERDCGLISRSSLLDLSAGAPTHYWRQLKVSIVRDHGFWEAKFVKSWARRDAVLRR